jgi:adenosylmethionine-8-amino-7-oxononanoate aminotransferase
MAGVGEAVVVSQSTHVLPLEFNRRYPVIVRGEGVWVYDAAGNRYLDAMSGGSMAATLGHGRHDIIAAARAQAEKLAYVHNERLTNPAQEQLAHELAELAPKGFTRVRFVTGGAEANEMAIQIARRYHVDRGQPKRWQVISPAQAYHGPTMRSRRWIERSRPRVRRTCPPTSASRSALPRFQRTARRSDSGKALRSAATGTDSSSVSTRS